MLGDCEGVAGRSCWEILRERGGLVRRFRGSETEILSGDSQVMGGRSCWENPRETEVFLGDSEGVGERSYLEIVSEWEGGFAWRF